MKPITEQDSNHNNLEQKSIAELLTIINNEDKTIAYSIAKNLNNIEQFIIAVVDCFKMGGRLFYIGSGTSGRLGVVDASECPPTYGVSAEMVIGIIAGGDSAIRTAVEFAEDDKLQGWKDLQEYKINKTDILLGISASGSTPYVLGALQMANKNGVKTGSLACNKDSKIGKEAKYKIEIEVGPEVITGSTRMKSGTAQKLVLNMITTTSMIKLGKVKGNKMVDMQLTNDKLIDRGTKMIMEQSDLDYQTANKILVKYGSVRIALDSIK